MISPRNLLMRLTNDVTAQIVVPIVMLMIIIIGLTYYILMEGINEASDRFTNTLNYRSGNALTHFSSQQNSFSSISLAVKAKQELLIDLQNFDNYAAMLIVLEDINQLFGSDIMLAFDEGELISAVGVSGSDNSISLDGINSNLLGEQASLLLCPSFVARSAKMADLFDAPDRQHTISDALCWGTLVSIVDANGDESLSIISLKIVSYNKTILKDMPLAAREHFFLLNRNLDIHSSTVSDNKRVTFENEHTDTVLINNEIFHTISKPLKNANDGIIGYLVSAKPDALLQTDIQRVALNAVVPLVGLIAVLSLLVIYMKIHVLNGIKAVINGLRSVSTGDFSIRIDADDTTQYNQVSVMKQDFNKTIEKLEYLYEELNHKNEEIMRQADKLEAANKSLRTMSITDGLTALFNRRHFDETLIKQYRRHMRISEPMAIILIDVDYFKIYNDNYGHLEGDRCLKEVAKCLHDSLNRPGDFLARYGGEEFVCLLECTDTLGAKVVAERIIENINQLQVPHQFSDVADHVTLSLGIAMGACSTQGKEHLHVFLADEQLYLSKEQGRNQYHITHIDVDRERKEHG